MKPSLLTTSSKFKLISLLTVCLLAPALAQAHPFHGGQGFSSGLSHPLLGLDHVLAMVAVGLWATQLGGSALWLVPATFVSLMAVGGAIGMMGIGMPMVETGIVISVLMLGVLIAAAARLPLAASMALVGLFAIFHGHAHGTEMTASVSAVSYGLGFVLATAALHACGIAFGLMAQRKSVVPAIRFVGAAIVLAGIHLCFV